MFTTIIIIILAFVWLRVSSETSLAVGNVDPRYCPESWRTCLPIDAHSPPHLLPLPPPLAPIHHPPVFLSPLERSCFLPPRLLERQTQNLVGEISLSPRDYHRLVAVEQTPHCDVVALMFGHDYCVTPRDRESCSLFYQSHAETSGWRLKWRVVVVRV